MPCDWHIYPKIQPPPLTETQKQEKEKLKPEKWKSEKRKPENWIIEKQKDAEILGPEHINQMILKHGKMFF